LSNESREEIENILRTKQVILLGLHATQLHARSKTNVWELPVDVLVTPEHYASYVTQFADVFPNTVVKERPAYAELLPKHSDILDKTSGHLLVRVFETMACHSFHEANGIRVASIPTLLQFFFAFVYADAHYLEGFNQNRIVCIAQRLIDLASKSRRFELLTPLECLGHQESLTDIKAATGELRAKTPKDSSDFLKFFFTYNPSQKTHKQSIRAKLRKSMKH
jgi:hypothetical protein